MESGWPYVVLCLVVPLLWGVVAARLFDWWQARRAQSAPAETGTRAAEADTDMYYI